jgi:hypothetical protein
MFHVADKRNSISNNRQPTGGRDGCRSINITDDYGVFLKKRRNKQGFPQTNAWSNL